MKDFAKITKLGSVVMLISGLALIASLLVSYPFASMFSMSQQIGGHMTTILAGAVFKIGYLVFAIGRHERGLDF